MVGEEPFDPERLEATNFDLVRRGFDPTSVRAHLRRAAEEYHRLRLERDELEGRLAELDDTTGGELEASRVAAALGVEAAQVLEAAHQAAMERAERAEREATAVSEEAAAEAEAARGGARTDAEEILADARRVAEELVDDGRTRGRDMVAEAQTVRERMLGDLARKRQTGRAQVEQLKAARDRLLESLSTVQSSLDTAVIDLVESIPDARSAAERAGLRVTSEPEITARQLEAEIESARLVGHPLVDGPDPGADDQTFDTGETTALSDLDSALEDRASDSAATDADLDIDLVEDDGDDGDDDDDGADTADADVVDDGDVGDGNEAEDGAELYDVEADDEADDGPELDESDGGEDATGVDVLFAKLRESRTDDEADDSEVDDRGRADGTGDPRLEARADATSVAVKALKKVLVDEQGTLLDGIRRSGGDAVHALIDDADAHDAPYDEAARPSLVRLAGDLGADAVDLEPALALLHTIALDPVRQRLAEVADATDDVDELSDTVRALYRESRSRRIPEAAAAAVVATDGLTVRVTTDGPVRWVVEPDGPCGPDCANNALAGELGPDEAFPTGDLHPPSHPGCTCRLIALD